MTTVSRNRILAAAALALAAATAGCGGAEAHRLTADQRERLLSVVDGARAGSPADRRTIRRCAEGGDCGGVDGAVDRTVRGVLER